MFNFKKAAAGSAVIAILLTGCLGGTTTDSVSDYNNKVMAGLNSINEAMGALFDSVAEEDADVETLEDTLNTQTEEIKGAIAEIRGLGVPAGDGVKEFSDETEKYAVNIEDFLNLMKQHVDAIKAKDESAVEKVIGKLKAKAKDISKIYGNIGVKQKEMAKKNNFELRQ